MCVWCAGWLVCVWVLLVCACSKACDVKGHLKLPQRGKAISGRKNTSIGISTPPHRHQMSMSQQTHVLGSLQWGCVDGSVFLWLVTAHGVVSVFLWLVRGTRSGECVLVIGLQNMEWWVYNLQLGFFVLSVEVLSTHCRCTLLPLGGAICWHCHYQWVVTGQ